MRKILFLSILLITAACSAPANSNIAPTAEPEKRTNLPAPSPTPRTVPSPTPTSPPQALSPTSTAVPTETVQAVPDLSGVTLFEATHLMDPRFFQVVLDGWPADAPEAVIVRVDKEIYDCDILFPEDYPNRLYCWGTAPRKGTQTVIQLIVENIPQPLLEIPFTVPSPGGG